MPRRTGRPGERSPGRCCLVRGYLSFMTRLPLLLAALVAVTVPLAAQSTAPRHARLEGTWQAKTEDEIRNITVRTDRSAQFGGQVGRWRGEGGKLRITVGDGRS